VIPNASPFLRSEENGDVKDASAVVVRNGVLVEEMITDLEASLAEVADELEERD
jgi:hypothetical protein